MPTRPDRFVDEVRLVAAAARRVVPFFAPVLRAVVLREAVLALPRAVERDAVFRVVRAAVFFAPVFRAVVFRAAVFRAVVFRAAVFLAVPRFVALFVPLLAAVFRAAVFFAPVFRAVVFRAVVFLAAPRFVALFVPLLAAVFRAAVFFAPVFRAPVLRAPVLLAPVRAPVVDAFRVVRLLRAGFVSVVDSSVVSSGMSVLTSPNQVDLSSVGISASFRRPRVQPSRLHKATSLYQPGSAERKVLEVEFACFLWILAMGGTCRRAHTADPMCSNGSQVIGCKGFPRSFDRLRSRRESYKITNEKQ
nr:hypothetical protein [Microvirga massiliensis]